MKYSSTKKKLYISTLPVLITLNLLTYSYLFLQTTEQNASSVHRPIHLIMFFITGNGNLSFEKNYRQYL